MILLHLLLFLLLCFFIFYLPGRFLLRKVGFISNYFSIVLSVSLGVGVGLFLISTYLLAWVHSEFLYSLLILPVVFLEWKPSYKELRKRLTVKSIITPEGFLIAIGTIAMTYLTWRSGSIVDGTYVFYGIHAVDSVYHQSLIGNMMHTFPPTHPGIAGLPLRGYNFFYDFLTVQVAKLYFFDRFDLFFRFMPFFTALFYGISGLSLTRYFSFNRIATYTTLYFLYFAQNFSYFFRLVPDNFASNFNFEIIQSLGNIHDPSVVFSTTLLFLVIVTISQLKDFKKWIIPAILLGVIPTMKIHTGVIAFIPLALISLYALVKQRDINYIAVFFLAGIISAVTYLPINFRAGYLIFMPFLLYQHYMDDSPMFTKAHWSIQYQIFQQHSNYLRMGFINFVVMIAYLLPNIGIRIAGFFIVFKFFKKSFWNYPRTYLLFAIITGFVVPSLFIQSVYAFVIIQFLWVASILLLFPTAIVLSSLVENRNRVIIGVYFIFLLILTVPGTVSELITYSENPYEVTGGLSQMTMDISDIVGEKESILVINRRDQNALYHVPFVSALSGRSVYYEPEVLEFAGTAEEIAKRAELVDVISEKLDSCENPREVSESLKTLLDISEAQYLLTLSSQPCPEQLDSLKLLRKYEDTSIYMRK